MMASPDEISGPTVLLVRMNQNLIQPSYTAWLNDRDLMRYSTQKTRLHTTESCRQYLASFDGTPHLLLAILDRTSRELVGTITAYIDEENRSADLGILVARPGRGIGAEAWGLLMEHLFVHRAMEAITAGTDARNTPMLRIFAKHGMTLVRRGPCLFVGEQGETLYFRVERQRWCSETGPR